MRLDGISLDRSPLPIGVMIWSKTRMVRSKLTLANYELILRASPKWKGVLGYNKFAPRVTIRKPPPWGGQASDAPGRMMLKSQTRIFFQRHYGLSPGLGDVGRAVQGAARRNSFHPVWDHIESLKWDGVLALRDVAANLLRCP